MSNSSDHDENQSLEQVIHLPTVQYYQKTYAGTLDNNDQKAVRVFREYESQERVRRLQQELMWIRDGKVKEMTLNRLVGKKRKAKYEGYLNWGKLMLVWISNVKK